MSGMINSSSSNRRRRRRRRISNGVLCFSFPSSLSLSLSTSFIVFFFSLFFSFFFPSHHHSLIFLIPIIISFSLPLSARSVFLLSLSLPSSAIYFSFTYTRAKRSSSDRIRHYHYSSVSWTDRQRITTIIRIYRLTCSEMDLQENEVGDDLLDWRQTQKSAGRSICMIPFGRIVKATDTHTRERERKSCDVIE